MEELLHQIFGFVCGQNPAHTWIPGGMMLPCCQRCTGLYAGALVALALHLAIRPALTGRFLEWTGFCLLLMVPFGFHWLPQGPWLRGSTGVLFGAGVATFLWLPISAAFPTQFGARTFLSASCGQFSGRYCLYWSLLILTSILLPYLASLNNRDCAFALTSVASAGAAVLAGLIAANACLLLRSAWRRPVLSQA